MRRMAVVLLTWGAATACGASERPDMREPMILTEQSPDAAAHARLGQPVEIRLRAQPGTGFSWVPQGPAKFLSPMEPIRGEALPGGWQTQRFRFSVRRAGTYRVTFSYEQPWPGGIKGARVRTFTIGVR